MSKVVEKNKFIALVKRSGLIEEQRLSALIERVLAEEGSAAVENKDEFSKRLIDANLLTKWQADKLLAGRHKGFHLGKYKLMRQIGKGGMSSVYLAEHMLMKQPRAIKVLPKNRVMDSAYLDRFRLEARAVARLDDPNIVRAYDIDNDGDIHYIVMEYVDGDDLHQVVHKHGPVSCEETADYITQAAMGLQHAHDQDLVHRDIKPANFLLDKKGTVKLLDLGLAKLVEDDVTSLTLANDENVLGTADYLAPEQALNSHAADARADIYSLGCTMYYLLAGRPPFPDGTISERLLKHQTATPDSLFKLRPDIPPSLVAICERMMAKKPFDRYQTAGEVAEVLGEWLAEQGRKPGGNSFSTGDSGSGSGRGLGSSSGSGRGLGSGTGVGSGVMSRYGRTPTPRPGTSPGSETISSADRDTRKLVDADSGSALDEDIGLAPLKDEEEEEGAISGFTGTEAGAESPDADASLDTDVSKPIEVGSLVEEEFHDPEAEAIAHRVAQRAKFNPLHPEGYTGKRQGPPWGLILGIGGGLLLLVILAIAALSSGN